MINFRYHLVSIIAVFLALALGIVMGSTVVDQAIVDGLRDTISRVRDDSSERAKENDRLRDELDQLQKSSESTAPFAVEGRLSAVPVALFAEKGVSEDTVKDTLALLRDAGAEVPGILWLEDSWALTSDESQDRLAELLGRDGDPETQRQVAFDRLAGYLAGEQASTGTTTTTGGDEAPRGPALLEALQDEKFIEFSDGDKKDLDVLSGPDVRALVLTGTNSVLLGTETLRDLGLALSSASVSAAAAEEYVDSDAQGAAGRGDAVEPIRSDEELAQDISTLDDIELEQGRVGSVLVLQRAADGEVGHYGYGRGAKQSFPAWPTS